MQKKLQNLREAATGSRDSRKKMQSGTEEKDQQEETSPLKLTPSIEDGCLKIDTKLILTRFLSHL